MLCVYICVVCVFTFVCMCVCVYYLSCVCVCVCVCTMYYVCVQNHEKVMQLLNGQLSRVASDPPVPHSNRDRLYTLALSIADR